MEGYGVTSAQGMVLEGSQNSYFRYPYYLLPTINSHAITSPAGWGLLCAAVHCPGADGV